MSATAQTFSFAGASADAANAPIAAIDVIWRSRHAVPLAFTAVLA